MASSGLEVSPSPLVAGAPDPTPPRSWRDFFLGSDTPPPPAVRAEDEVDRRLKPGTLLGKDWEILGPLGSGGMSDVFLAFNRRDHRRYALKVLAEKHRDNPSEVARFELEYLALTRVRHESIVVPFVAGCEGGIPYYAMELLEGESLERAFTRQRLSVASSNEGDLQLGAELIALSVLSDAPARPAERRGGGAEQQSCLRIPALRSVTPAAFGYQTGRR